MRIPARFAPILFGALLSAIMVAIVSAFVLATSQGIHAGFAGTVAQELRDDLARGLRGGDPASRRGCARSWVALTA